MKNKILIIAVITAILISLPFISRQESAQQASSGYPWDITLHESGHTSVFGLTPGQTSMRDVRTIIGNDVKLALISTDDEAGSVEMYYAHYTAGRLSGRLIVVADLDQDAVLAIKSRAMRSGGEHIFRIHNDDLNTVLQSPMKGLTFIPIVDLDDAIIQQRFGKPSEIVSHATLKHYLYPQKGLDVVLDDNGKEVLQYVAPKQFEQLVLPLRQ